MKNFLIILFKGVRNGYETHLKLIDEQSVFKGIKIIEYMLTISIATTIRKVYRSRSKFKVYVEFETKLIATYARSPFGGLSNVLTSSQKNEMFKNTEEIKAGRVDIVVFRGPRLQPKILIEIKSINPTITNLKSDTTKLIKLLNFAVDPGRKMIEMGYVVAVFRLDNPSEVLNRHEVYTRAKGKETEIENALAIMPELQNFNWAYNQEELDVYTKEDYLDFHGSDEELNDAKASTHAYFTGIISLTR